MKSEATQFSVSRGALRSKSLAMVACAAAISCIVSIVHGAESERHVTPVAALLRVVLVHGEQLDDAEAEGGNAVELVDECSVGTRMFDAGGGRHAAHVRLVHHRRPARAP